MKLRCDFHLLENILSLSLVGFRGNLSHTGKCVFFQGAEAMDDEEYMCAVLSMASQIMVPLFDCPKIDLNSGLLLGLSLTWGSRKVEPCLKRAFLKLT